MGTCSDPFQGLGGAREHYRLFFLFAQTFSYDEYVRANKGERKNLTST